MNQSEKLDQIAPALVAAQEKLKNPRTDQKATVQTKTGKPYSYAYLSLPALLEEVRTAFKALGLALSQEIQGSVDGVLVTTRIVHLSGQWMDFGPLFLPVSGGPQDFGSAITYGRRYSLAAAVGLAAEEDDDAARPQQRKSEGMSAATPASGSAREVASGSSPQPVAPPRAAPQETGPTDTPPSEGPAPALSVCKKSPDGKHKLIPAPNPEAAKRGAVMCKYCREAGHREKFEPQESLV